MTITADLPVVETADDVQTTLAVLSEALTTQATASAKWTAYYEGRQPLSYLAPELAREMDDRIRSVVINWPELVVDSLEERLDVEGFRLPDDAESDDGLWGWWQANDLDSESGIAHIDALTTGRSFAIIGTGDRHPLVTVESGEQVITSYDPRTRAVTAALKRWHDDDENADYGTLYLPGVTYSVERAPGTFGRWAITATDVYDLPLVPVVPLVNRRRVLDPRGRSELASVVPLSDAACKIATDMMVAAEFHAMPRRWAVGLTEEDFLDPEGRPLSKWSRIAGRVWTSMNPETKMGQFPEAQLQNFHQTIDSLAQMVASIAGLPPHYLGMTAENPASADAIRSAESRLVKRAERRQRAFGAAWEQVMRLATWIDTGREPTELDRLECVWRDASTPTIAQKADAAVKLHAAGISTTRQAREDVGYSLTQIGRMEAEDEAEGQAVGVTPRPALGVTSPLVIPSAPTDIAPSET